MTLVINSMAAGPKKPCSCCQGFNSFTGETLVSVKPENAQQTEALNGKVELKPISQIVVGDEVLAFSEWRDKGEISNQDQRLSYEKVTDVYTSYKQQVLVHLSLDNGATITATEGHPFKTDEGWRDAIMLKKGGKLLLKGGDEEEANNQLLLQPKVDDKNTLSATQNGLPTSDSTRTITEIRLEKKVVAVYNLEVANAHTFFVGEDGVLVHNGHGHHSWPKYLGGAEKQDLYDLPAALHYEYHFGLDKHLKRCKGKAHYDALRGKELEKMYAQFIAYTDFFDSKHGTGLMFYARWNGFSL